MDSDATTERLYFQELFFLIDFERRTVCYRYGRRIDIIAMIVECHKRFYQNKRWKI